MFQSVAAGPLARSPGCQTVSTHKRETTSRQYSVNRIVFLAAACVLLWGGASVGADEIRIEHDVNYLGADRKEKADLYLPTPHSMSQRFPGVIIIHGGGWSGGDKRQLREVNISTNLARRGYVCMSINYLLADPRGTDITWPRNLYDCKSAVRWLRRNAARFQVDPGHIGAIGGSAGGHLSAMLALTGAKDGLDPQEPYGEFSCGVQAAVDLYGPADLLNWQDLSMLRKKRSEAPEAYIKASPLTYADKTDPPLLIFHGTADTIVPAQQSELLASALEKAGVPHQLVIVPGGVHGFHLEPKQQDLRPLVLGFFDKYLKANP